MANNPDAAGRPLDLAGQQIEHDDEKALSRIHGECLSERQDPRVVRNEPVSVADPPKERSIELLRKTLSMLCHFVWNKTLRPGEHMWSIPVDKERDFDCILSDAIDELEQRRAELAASRPGEPWQPISSAPKDGRDILAWDGYNQMVTAWIVFSEDRAEWNSHAMCAEDPILWMPLPAPPKDADQ